MQLVKKDFKFRLDDMKHTDRNHYRKWITPEIEVVIFHSMYRRNRWGYNVIYRGENMFEDVGKSVWAANKREERYGRLLAASDKCRYWSAGGAFDAMMGDVKFRWWYFKLPKDRPAKNDC